VPSTNRGAVDVAIIGAGPAGLTAAYLLTKKGYSVTVIEKDPVYVGGISRTVEYEGFRFDIGGHRFFSKSKEVVDLCGDGPLDECAEAAVALANQRGGKDNITAVVIEVQS